MAEDTTRAGLHPTTVVNIVFYVLLLNIGIVAAAFLVLAGIAAIQQATALANAATEAATFLDAIAVFGGLLRSFLVDLLARLATD